ncbi:MAG: CHAP domain-containing protein [Lachnospiraceae bacterium]|nr:CHAP domain-containing protein [Lachnospiraceae bacterium]
MENATKEKLVKIAREKAEMPFHGYLGGKESNIEPIIKHFPKWNIKDADRLWCAAFVYYCCMEAGFQFPYSPNECVTCSLAGCGGWEEYAMGDSRIEYHRRNENFVPKPGDIVIYDRVFINQEHDHIGIILEVKDNTIIVAEGNTFNDNISRVIERPIDDHIRSYIRIPDGYRYLEN